MRTSACAARAGAMRNVDSAVTGQSEADLGRLDGEALATALWRDGSFSNRGPACACGGIGERTQSSTDVAHKVARLREDALMRVRGDRKGKRDEEDEGVGENEHDGEG